MMSRKFVAILVMYLAAGSASAQSCVQAPDTLCLLENRFEVVADWKNEQGNGSTINPNAGGGRAGSVPFLDNWGGFQFFDSDNVEMLVHIFNGCGFSGERYWVFAAGLTNVEVDLVVTDTQTGEVVRYSNPQGRPFVPITDTGAFNTCPKSVADTLKPPVEPPVTLGGCSSSSTRACLLGGRFGVSATLSGAEVAVSLAADGTAAFSFGNPSFFDLFVNVADGRFLNGNYWVTTSLFSPTDVTVRVTDELLGESRDFQISANDPLIVSDRTAFVGEPTLTVDGTFLGAYFDLERSGEGFILDVADIGGVPTAILYFFTYDVDGSGDQAWMVGSGPILGDRATIPMVITRNGEFGAGFDSESIDRIPWGNGKITFDQCGDALVEVSTSLYPDFSRRLTNLTPAGVGVAGLCDAQVTAGPSGLDGGYGGSWFAPERNGEGLIFNVVSLDGVATLVVFYFTYADDGSGRQAWMVGSAPISGRNVTVPAVITSGTGFGENFSADEVLNTPWGEIQVEFIDCQNARVQILSPLFGNVNFDIIPLTPPPPGTSGECALVR